VSFCAVDGCPGLGFPYEAVIATPDGILRVVLCTEHRKTLPAEVEVLSIQKRDPGPQAMANPYEGASRWPDVPFVLPD
jgi:hypothetical protein